MIRSISISNLRGIRQAELTDLTPLVVLVGPNNAGKSTILDAILLGASPNPGWALKRVLQRRVGLDDRHAQRWLLWSAGQDHASEAQIAITGDNKAVRVVHLVRADRNSPESGVDVRGAGGISPRDISRLRDISDVSLVDLFGPGPREPLTALYTRVAERGLKRQCRDLLTELIPEIRDFETLAPGNEPMLYFEFPDGARPEATVGDGVRFLLRIAFELTAPKDSVVLLEEPEMHMHPAAIRQTARAILAALRRGVQVILTTHSLDLIDALLAHADDGQLKDLAFFRVLLRNGQLSSFRTSGHDAGRARTEVEEDLR